MTTDLELLGEGMPTKKQQAILRLLKSGLEIARELGLTPSEEYYMWMRAAGASKKELFASHQAEVKRIGEEARKQADEIIAANGGKILL